jgi:hypothetical protein
LAVGDIKQHLVNRGARIKQMGESGAAAPPAMPPVLPAVPGSGPADLASAKKLMSSGMFAQTGEGPPPVPPAPPLPQEAVPPPVPGDAPVPGGQGSVFTAVPPPPVPPPQAGTGPAGPVPPPLGPPQPLPPASWKRPMWIGAAVGLALAIGAGAFLIAFRKSASGGAPGGPAVAVDIATTPPGASIRVNGDAKCTASCQVSLEPGDYQITAFLDGYDAAVSVVNVKAGQPASVHLALEPQPQMVRVFTDLEQGKVTFDDQPAMDLQEGQFIVEKVAPGAHTLKVTGRNSEASLSFELATARLPAVTGAINTRNLFAVVVASFASQARVTTGPGSFKLAANGQAQADATPAGVDLSGYQPGVSELVLGEGNDQRNMKENYTPAPALTVFLKSDQNIGTLIVATGEDDVQVFLNNRPYGGRTKRGEVRIRSAVGRVSVRVAKDGFEAPPPRVAEVKKGGETRLEFALKAQPQFATLQIRGGTPGADVLVDQRPVGAVGADGSFSHGSVLAGARVVELRLSQHVPKRFEREFRAGQTVTIAAPDSVLASDRPPPTPQVVVEAKKPEPPPASKPPAPAPPKVYTMADFDDPAMWRNNADGIFTHRGQAFLTFKPNARGVFSFTAHLVRGGSVFRGGRARWFVDFTDTRNHLLFEMDDKNLWVKDVVNGRQSEKSKTEHKQGAKVWTVQIDVNPNRVSHKMFIKGQWYNLDEYEQAGRDLSDGKFGFLVQGDDEIGVSNFTFTAAR